MSTQNTEERIEVKEEADGSAVVNLPDNIPAPEQDVADEPAEEVEASAPADEDADSPGDSDALREAKRARRKAKRELVKKTNQEKDHRLALLQKQNQELMERLSAVERKTHSADIARIDKAIEDQELRLKYARMKIAEATSAGDGEAVAKAQEMWYESRQQLESLKNFKQTAATPRQQNNIPDPRLQQNAAEWMDRNKWYKPDAKDLDSKIAKQVDEALMSEGWDPTSEDYWEELDNRLQQYLPHRYNRKADESSSSSRSRPRSMVTSSGRESPASAGGRNTFSLSAEQVRAMKDAGFWDDPEKRARMIKRYAQEARQSQGYRS
jgi:hypothetical protein